ncbi:voltage-dependent calcium channel subunit alpha-2/delta-3, partial [Clonorchis sinensis]
MAQTLPMLVDRGPKPDFDATYQWLLLFIREQQMSLLRDPKELGFSGFSLKQVYRSPSFGKREMTEEAAFELLDKAAEKINNIVKQKAELVHKIKLAAEEAYRTRTHREPTGVSSKTIVSVGNWTGALDAVFRENAATDPTLKWQYFGSSTGFFQFYPGSMWDIQLDELRLDFFDCRSQPWYLSASSYAKEMLILVDKSGSMKGRSDIISNATVTEILNTLTENDFFNIIMFTDTPRYADPAIQDRLIQAFKYNKDRMVRRFQNFNPNGTAHYERALTEAFSLMNKTRENQTNSKHCSQMLMIITDSVPDSYKELLEKLDPDKNVRIFVYLLGQHSYAEPYVEELACLNRGYAVTIATLADVKENVLKYLNVVARSNAILNHGFITWSGVTVRQFNLKPAYKLRSMHKEPSDSAGDIRLEEPKIDTMIALKEEEPVMYTSVAEAVYDRTKKAMRLKQGNLLGVAGIDVPLQSFRDALRGWQAGVNNYLFAVDNNGFVLFHPGYRPVYKSTLKSHYQNVDLNEVEVPQDVKIDPNTGTPDYATPLREAMIERERKTNDLPAQIVTDNFHTTFQATRKFFSTPLEQTPFTLGLAVQWNAETGRGDAIPEFVGAKAMANEQVQSDMDYLLQIRLDAKETQPLQKFWTQVHSSPLISKNFIKDHIFGVEDPLYAETVLTNQYFHEQKLTVFHPPPNDLFRHFSSQNLDVPIPMTMTVYNEIHQVPMAVVGLQITHHNLQKQFDKMTNACLTDNCRPCGNEVDCYLINQAALVLVSSGGEKE